MFTIHPVVLPLYSWGLREMDRGLKDTTIHDYARAIKTLLRFWYSEKYIPEPVVFTMPKLVKKRLPVLTPEQVQIVIKACGVRDCAIVYFIVDSGLRRSEVIALNWGDVDMTSGLVTVKRGKGGKARSAVIGVKTRRALLKYRRTIPNHDLYDPLFQTDEDERFTGHGFLAVFRRLTKKTGVHITPHSLRRTFVIMSLRSGMDVLHLQAMLGHSSLAMVEHYAQMVDDDLIQEHRKHSPVDSL